VSRRSPIPDTPIEEKPCQIELWDFVDALAKARPVEIDATEGLKSKAVSEAGLRIREIRTGRQSG